MSSHDLPLSRIDATYLDSLLTDAVAEGRQLDYKEQLIERVGMALFYEAGTVADSVDRLPAAQVHMSYGVGLRVSLERTAVFRADVGFSREDVNVTVGFGLSF